MSVEQGAVVAAFVEGRHVACTAVAGAGKTTTMLLCAERCPERACLLLTYNKRLQSEVAGRAPASVRAMTYHAACGAAYGKRVFTDDEMDACLRERPVPSLFFDALLLDEVQDTTPMFHALARWLLGDNPRAQVVVVGDARQCINEYRGASAVYLERAEEFFTPPGSERAWARLTLRGSYRLTPATAKFVNAHLYNADVIDGLSLAPDRKPIYVATGPSWDDKAGAWIAATRRACAVFGAGNVYLLAASVRNLQKTPLGAVVRALTDVPMAVSDDEHRPSPETERGKLVVTTFNQSKGSERDCVIVAGLDETYFRYFSAASESTGAVGADGSRIAPNTMSVAATRAKRLLVVLAAGDATLRSIEVGTVAEDAKVHGEIVAHAVQVPRARGPTTVGACVRYASQAARAEMRGMYTTSASPLGAAAALGALGRIQNVPSLVRGFTGRYGALCEDFGFAYGLLAPALADLELGGDPKCLARCKVTKSERASFAPAIWDRIDVAGIGDSVLGPGAGLGLAPPSHWLARCVLSDAVRNGHFHYPRQVTEYSWADEPEYASFLRETTRTAVAAATAYPGGAFETPLAWESGDISLLGVADYAAPCGHMLEFKLGEVNTDASLQLACYLAMRGGGIGEVVSLASRECLRVTVDRQHAGTLLAAITKERCAVVCGSPGA